MSVVLLVPQDVASREGPVSLLLDDLRLLVFDARVETEDSEESIREPLIVAFLSIEEACLARDPILLLPLLLFFL